MTHEIARHAAHYPKIWKDEIIQTSPVVAIKRLKDPSTWLKVATTIEKPHPPPTNPKRAETRIFQKNKVNILAAGVHARLDMQDEGVLVFHDAEF